MTLLFYRILYFLSLCVAFLSFPFSKKLRRGLSARRGLLRRLPKLNNPLWFHVASSGELEQCLAILDSVRAKNPEQSIFVSFFSPSAERAVALEKKRRDLTGTTLPWDHADYSPFDLRFSVRRFLKRIKPKALIVIHRELWPVLIDECKRQKVSVFLFATYFPKATQNQLPLYQETLNKLTGLATVDENSRGFFSETLKRLLYLEQLGDPRIDRVLMRRQKSRPQPWESFFEGQTVALFASVWPKDLEALKPTIMRIQENYPHVRIVCVPHENNETFCDEVKETLSFAEKKARFWSHWLKEPDFHSPLVVNQIGVLAELYRVASFVFVGGSFQAKVHNVLEPAAYAKPVITGPFIENSAEALQMSDDRGLFKVDTAEDLAQRAQAFIELPEFAKTEGEKIHRYLIENSGASDRYQQALFQWLKPRPAHG